MDDLREFIEDLLEIPFISEGGAVMDGSFALTPYYIDSLLGNGSAQSITVLSSVDLFYQDRNEAVQNGIMLYKALLKDNKYTCENPDVTYEEASNYWRTTMRVQEVI